MAGKRFLRKAVNGLCRYPDGQNFRRNRSVLFRYRDKRVFAFNAEIQDGRQKWRENDFYEKSPVDFEDTLWVKKLCRNRSISLHFQDKHAFAFNAEVQDGC